MSKKTQHQKKRNTALLYEFLTHYISDQLMQGNRDKYKKAVKILKNAFKKDSELMKEFKLMRSLTKATVSAHVAHDVVLEAKQRVKSIDALQLDREKSWLIKNINHHLNENNTFYDAEVSNYKIYATTQVLFNMWRDQNADVGTMGQYSSKLIEHLTTDKSKKLVETNELADKSHGTLRLLMKVMTHNLNEKYAQVLSHDQKSLIKSYVYATATQNFDGIKKSLVETRNDIVANIDGYLPLTSSDLVKDKLSALKTKLVSESVDVIDQPMIVKFLSYIKLNDELMNDEKKDSQK